VECADHNSRHPGLGPPSEGHEGSPRPGRQDTVSVLPAGEADEEVLGLVHLDVHILSVDLEAGEEGVLDHCCGDEGLVARDCGDKCQVGEVVF